jgi:hypothetical protein
MKFSAAAFVHSGSGRERAWSIWRWLQWSSRLGGLEGKALSTKLLHIKKTTGHLRLTSWVQRGQLDLAPVGQGNCKTWRAGSRPSFSDLVKFSYCTTEEGSRMWFILWVLGVTSDLRFFQLLISELLNEDSKILQCNPMFSFYNRIHPVIVPF